MCSPRSPHCARTAPARPQGGAGTNGLRPGGQCFHAMARRLTGYLIVGARIGPGAGCATGSARPVAPRSPALHEVAAGRRPGHQPARIAVDGRLRHRRWAILEDLQPHRQRQLLAAATMSAGTSWGWARWTLSRPTNPGPWRAALHGATAPRSSSTTTNAGSRCDVCRCWAGGQLRSADESLPEREPERGGHRGCRPRTEQERHTGHLLVQTSQRVVSQRGGDHVRPLTGMDDDGQDRVCP
jgi:hypothetical protein